MTQEVSFGLGEVLLEEGARADRVLILKEGECSVLKALRPDFFAELLAQRQIRDKSLQRSRELAAFVEAVLASKTIRPDFQLCIANPGELIGFEAAVSEPFASGFSFVAARQPTVAYAVGRQDFLKFFKPVLEETAQALRALQRLRVDGLLSRLATVVKVGTMR